MNTYSPQLAADIIKIFEVRRSLIKKSNKITNLIKSSEFNGKNFGSFLNKITKKSIIESFKNYLVSLKLLIRLNGVDVSNNINTIYIKNILSAFTLKYYPDIMNIDKSNEVSTRLMEKAKILTTRLKIILALNNDNKFGCNINTYIKGFFNTCLEFQMVFKEWKTLDLEAIICNMAKIYIDLESEYKDIEEDYKSEELLNLTKRNFKLQKKKNIRQSEKN